jgi:hypothetical protein
LIAEVEDLKTLLELARLNAELAEYRSELQLLEQTRQPSTATTTRIAELKESIQTNLASTEKYEQKAAAFQVRSHRAGQVIPEWTNVRTESVEQLDSWSGSPLSPENLGAKLTSGQKICAIGRLDDLEAILAVNEHDVEFVSKDQQVTLMLDAAPDERLQGKIQEIASKEAESLPDSLTQKNGGDIQLKPKIGAQQKDNKPANEHFEARVPITVSQGLSVGLRGQAQIYVGSRTAFERLQLIVYRIISKKL